GADTSDDASVIEAALQQFYAEHAPPPDIHVPVLPPEHEALENWLSSRSSRRVRVAVPQRGPKRGLVDLARRNAELGYQTRFDANQTSDYDGLEMLQSVLRLPELPRRIECFDISTIQGSETVASMVVCEDGRMKRSEYRKFRISPSASLGGAAPSSGAAAGELPRFLDDFAAMEQVVRRRYARLVERGGPFPDLIVIDGGKGQLNAAYAALESVGLS